MPATDEIKRRNGNPDAILAGLASKSPIYRFQAICGAVNHNVRSEKIIDRISTLTDDKEIVMGYSIAMLAKSALAKFGISKYKGDDERIKTLIHTDIWFDR